MLELFDFFLKLSFDVFRHATVPLGQVTLSRSKAKPGRGGSATSNSARQGARERGREETDPRKGNRKRRHPRPGPRAPFSRLYDAGVLAAAAGFLGVEIALQDQNSGDLVDHGPVLGAGAAGGVEMAVGFGGGEALVPKVYGQSEGLAQGFGKGMGFGGLGADVAGHVQGIAENNGRTAEFAQEAA